jgi:hypothetical protein
MSLGLVFGLCVFGLVRILNTHSRLIFNTIILDLSSIQHTNKSSTQTNKTSINKHCQYKYYLLPLFSMPVMSSSVCLDALCDCLLHALNEPCLCVLLCVLVVTSLLSCMVFVLFCHQLGISALHPMRSLSPPRPCSKSRGPDHFAFPVLSALTSPTLEIKWHPTSLNHDQPPSFFAHPPTCHYSRARSGTPSPSP